MQDSLPLLLYLTHRIPYPPNKGDKVRSFNILRQLARTHRVWLGTFVDHRDDLQHIPTLAASGEDGTGEEAASLSTLAMVSRASARLFNVFSFVLMFG